MAYSLVAFGSNLGERAAQLQFAVRALAQLPESRLIARSHWYETAAVGGPPDQQPFLNGAALLSTSLPPKHLFAQLVRIEAEGGRERGERWAARTLDLDLLLYNDLVMDSPELTLPHPRMVYRPFVLLPAAELAPWMVHAESDWTIGRLLDQLQQWPPSVAVAGEPRVAARIIARINAALDATISRDAAAASRRPTIASWSENSDRPALLLAAADAGIEKRQLRKMLKLPPTGPVVWISAEPVSPDVDEALAAVQAAWPVFGR